MIHSEHVDLVRDGYAGQVRTLRSAAKWLLATWAAVGAVLVGGLQLSGISQLPFDSWQPYVALSAVVLALTAIGDMIRSASVVLTREWLTLASIIDEHLLPPELRRSATAVAAATSSTKCGYMRWLRKKLRDGRARTLASTMQRLDESRHELYGHVAPTLADLHRILRESNEVIWRPDLDTDARHAATERSRHVRQTAGRVVQAANYYYLLHLFRGMRTRMAWGALITTGSIVTLVYMLGLQGSEPFRVEIVN